MIARLALLAFWAALVFAMVMATLPHPPALIALNDKYQHMMAFATLAGLAALAFPATPLWRIGERLSFVGALIELIQSIPALNRDCDIMDWVADTAAITAVLVLFAIVRAFARSPDPRVSPAE